MIMILLRSKHIWCQFGNVCVVTWLIRRGCGCTLRIRIAVVVKWIWFWRAGSRISRCITVMIDFQLGGLTFLWWWYNYVNNIILILIHDRIIMMILMIWSIRTDMAQDFIEWRRSNDEIVTSIDIIALFFLCSDTVHIDLEVEGNYVKAARGTCFYCNTWKEVTVSH